MNINLSPDTITQVFKQFLPGLLQAMQAHVTRIAHEAQTVPNRSVNVANSAPSVAPGLRVMSVPCNARNARLTFHHDGTVGQLWVKVGAQRADQVSSSSYGLKLVPGQAEEIMPAMGDVLIISDQATPVPFSIVGGWTE